MSKMEGKPELITSDPALCIPQSDIIFIAGVPIHHNPALLQQMKPHLPTDKKVYAGEKFGRSMWYVVYLRRVSGTTGIHRVGVRVRGLRLGGPPRAAAVLRLLALWDPAHSLVLRYPRVRQARHHYRCAGALACPFRASLP